MTFTTAQKEAYRLHKMGFAYDRACVARDIIRAGYYRHHPNAAARPRDGILSCGLPNIHEAVKVYLDENGHEYHNHKSCKSWACPICAPKRAAERANEMERVMLAAHEHGYKMLFITFTVPHRKAHSSAYVINRLNACYNKFLQARAIRNIKKEFGYVGAIKCLDYTLTDNGTHAHLHTIFIFDTELAPFDLLCSFGAQFVKQWDKTVYNECKQHISQRHGFSIECVELDADADSTSAALAHYAAKAISVYCADKDKDKSSLTPFDLLNSKATAQERERFYDFYKGQKGRRHVMLSPGLREHLGIVGEGKKDERAAAVVATIEYEHGYFLRDEQNRAEFERRLRANVSSALCWLNAEAKKQQRDLGSRYRDREDRPLNFAPVALVDAVYELDSGMSLLSDKIAMISAAQRSFLQDYEDVQERVIMEKNARRHEEYEKYLNRVKGLHERECRSAKKEKRPPRSGLGSVLAYAATFRPDSVFPVPAPPCEDRPYELDGKWIYLDDADFHF